MLQAILLGAISILVGVFYLAAAIVGFDGLGAIEGGFWKGPCLILFGAFVLYALLRPQQDNRSDENTR